MKRYFLVFATALLAVSCTKGQMITDIPGDINSGSGSGAGTMATGKRGVAFNTGTPNWARRVVDLKSHWYYTWGSTDVSDQVRGAEFVPMIHGKGATNESIRTACLAINQMFLARRCFFVLGFNEPDLASEANMTVADALDKWQIMTETLLPGIKLVSPAPSYPTRQWLYDFIKGCDARNLRVDYIAVHIYAGIGTNIYETAIRDAYLNCGNRRVWVTEFAPRDDNAATNGYNSYDMTTRVLPFMQDVVSRYERMSEVFRYAWFSPGTASISPPNMIGLITSQLTNNDGTALTVLGDYYKSVNPNNSAALP